MAICLWNRNYNKRLRRANITIIIDIVIKPPRYTGGDFVFLYRFVRRRHRLRRRRLSFIR